jgi:pseudaminic acid synthase
MNNFKINSRNIGPGHPCYIIAEVSCNHEGNFDEARRIVEASAYAGADAVKLQTYTADTMTRDFKTRPTGTMWENIDLYKLYQKAYTPWDWYEKLGKIAVDLGMQFFSTPFDETAVDFLVAQGAPVLKVASFEVVDIKLLEKMAKTGLPIIMSNGMTDFLEMDEAVRTLRVHGTTQLAILHCNSGYPASFDEANLATIPALAEIFKCPVGISDHTIFADDKNYALPMAHMGPLEAVRSGANIIEVHVMMDREKGRQLNKNDKGGFDWPFSREPSELKTIVDRVREFEKTGEMNYTEAEHTAAARLRGRVNFDPTEKEIKSRVLRPSLWAIKDIQKGDTLIFAGGGKDGNFDSIRPAGGIHIRFTDHISGKNAATDIKAGTPLSWACVA